MAQVGFEPPIKLEIGDDVVATFSSTGDFLEFANYEIDRWNQWSDRSDSHLTPLGKFAFNHQLNALADLESELLDLESAPDATTQRNIINRALSPYRAGNILVSSQIDRNLAGGLNSGAQAAADAAKELGRRLRDTESLRVRAVDLDLQDLIQRQKNIREHNEILIENLQTVEKRSSALTDKVISLDENLNQKINGWQQSVEGELST